MAGDLIRETAFVSAALHARAVQWDGSHEMAKSITDELNLLALEFYFRLTAARYEASMKASAKFEWEIERPDGVVYAGELAPTQWLALLIRHGRLTAALIFDAEDGEDIFDEMARTVIIGEGGARQTEPIRALPPG